VLLAIGASGARRVRQRRPAGLRQADQRAEPGERPSRPSRTVLRSDDFKVEVPGLAALEDAVAQLRTSYRSEGDGQAPVELNAPLRNKVAEACPGLSQNSSCANVGDREAVFLTISGLARRLIIDSTLANVVRPMSNDGFAVHVYMSLIDKEDPNPWNKAHVFGKRRPVTMLPPGEMQSHLASMVEAAGGCLMCFMYSYKSENIREVPSECDEQMSLYRPQNFRRKVLRLWKTRQALWTFGMQAERQWNMRYALALWTRDDTYWTKRLVNVSTLLEQPKSATTVWSKDCHKFGGMNDKVVLFGRDAADTMFGLYDRFFEKPIVPGRVGSRKKKIPSNSEKYIMTVAERKGLNIKLLSHSEVPSGDALFIGTPTEYCLIKSYWCGSEDEVLADGSSWCPRDMHGPLHGVASSQFEASLFGPLMGLLLLRLSE